MVARSYRFALYNIRRIWPCLTKEAAQLLIQALISRLLDYCNSLLVGLPASACVQPTKILPCGLPLLWPPLTPCSSHQIQDNGTGLQGCQRNCPYLPPSVSQTPSLQLECTAQLHQLAWLVPPSLRASKGHTAKSQPFSVLAPQWWNELPADVRTADSLTSFRKTQDSLDQSSPGLCIASFLYLPPNIYIFLSTKKFVRMYVRCMFIHPGT